MSKPNHLRSLVFCLLFKIFSKTMQGFPKCVRPFSMIFIRIIAFKSVEKPKTIDLSMSLNESFGFVWAWIKPKCLLRLNKNSSFGLFNYFISYNPSKYGYNHKRASSLHGFGGIIIIFFFFCLRGGFPTLPWDFSTLLHNDPAAHQNNCGRCRIRTRDLCPKSLKKKN